MPALYFYQDHHPDNCPGTLFKYPVNTCDCTRDTLEGILQHAVDARTKKPYREHSFLMQLIKDSTCTLVGCGTKTDDLRENFQHTSEKHGWTGTKRYTRIQIHNPFPDPHLQLEHLFDITIYSRFFIQRTNFDSTTVSGHSSHSTLSTPPITQGEVWKTASGNDFFAE